MALVVMGSLPPPTKEKYILALSRMQIGSIVDGCEGASGLTGLMSFDARRDEADVRHASSYKHKAQSARSSWPFTNFVSSHTHYCGLWHHDFPLIGVIIALSWVRIYTTEASIKLWVAVWEQ